MKGCSPIYLLGGFAVILHLALYFSGLSVTPGHLHDPDAYMRLERVENLVSSGNWFEQTNIRENAPFGNDSHWSRPVDCGLLLVAAPFMIFMPFEDALWVAGVLWAPLLLIPCLLALDGVARRFFDLEGRLLTSLLFLTQPGLLNYFVAARPDHHSLILTLVVAAWCCGVHTLFKPEGTGFYLLAGLLCALGQWVSIEFLVPWFVLAGGWALYWLTRPEIGPKVTLFHATHTACSALFLLLETPRAIASDWWLDRLSGFHLTLFLLTTVLWWFFSKSRLHSVLARLLVGSLAAFGILGLMHFFFPGLIRGPFGKVSPELKAVWLDHVQELQPLASDAKGALIGILTWLPVLIPASVYLVFCFLDKDRRSVWLSPRGSVWAFAATFTLLLSVYQKRWVGYADLIWMVPAVMGIWLFFQSVADHRWFRLLRVVTLIGLCGGPVLLARCLEMVEQAQKEFPSTHSPSPSDSTSRVSGDMFEALRGLHANDQHVILLNFIDDGPEILYRTPHSVLATPYHRNESGILDAHAVLSGPSRDHPPRRIIDRGVDYVLVSPGEPESAYYHSDNKKEESLYLALVKENPPHWLSLSGKVNRRDGSKTLIYQVHHLKSSTSRPDKSLTPTH